MQFSRRRAILLVVRDWHSDHLGLLAAVKTRESSDRQPFADEAGEAKVYLAVPNCLKLYQKRTRTNGLPPAAETEPQLCVTSR